VYHQTAVLLRPDIDTPCAFERTADDVYRLARVKVGGQLRVKAGVCNAPHRIDLFFGNRYGLSGKGHYCDDSGDSPHGYPLREGKPAKNVTWKEWQFDRSDAVRPLPFASVESCKFVKTFFAEDGGCRFFVARFDAQAIPQCTSQMSLPTCHGNLLEFIKQRQ